jgi:transcription factor SPN1
VLDSRCIEIVLLILRVASDGNDGLSDFEAMLQRKREEQSKRRKRKDIDIINDNDDIIAQLLADMRNAAEVSARFRIL